MAEAVQRNLTTVSALRDELTRGPRRGSRLLRYTLSEVSDGVRSSPEAELRAILRNAGIEAPVHWNPELRDAHHNRLPSPDGWIDEVGIAIEVDSREYHLSPEDWARTIDRHNQLVEHGALVLHFTPRRIRRDPRGVRDAMKRA